MKEQQWYLGDCSFCINRFDCELHISTILKYGCTCFKLDEDTIP